MINPLKIPQFGLSSIYRRFQYFLPISGISSVLIFMFLAFISVRQNSNNYFFIMPNTPVKIKIFRIEEVLKLTGNKELRLQTNRFLSYQGL